MENKKTKSMTYDEMADWLRILTAIIGAFTFIALVTTTWATIKANKEKEQKNQEQRERIALLEKEVADAKTKQAEAEKALLELKDRVQPRKLTAQQKSDFVQKLKALPSGVIKLGYTSNNNDDGFDLTQQFLPLFKEAGWTVENGLSNHLEQAVVGIGILVRGDEGEPTVSLTPTLLTLQSAFKSIGMEVQFINWDTDTPEVIVGSKPTP